MQEKIGFIGAGNMGSAIIKGAIDSSISSHEKIWASDIDNSRLEYLESELNINTTQNNKELVKKSDVIVIAVKPQDIDRVLDEIKDAVGKKLVISIAAGIKIKHIEAKLKDAKVIRVMPNVACTVGEAASAYSIGKKADELDVEIVSAIFNAIGKAYLVKNESLLDAVTALSGSGPAFFALIIDALSDGAVQEGLTKEIALKLAAQTAKGTAKLLLEKDITPKQLADMVTSKGGTTEAGRKILETKEVRNILINTIKAAAKRSRELGKSK